MGAARAGWGLGVAPVVGVRVREGGGGEAGAVGGAVGAGKREGKGERRRREVRLSFETNGPSEAGAARGGGAQLLALVLHLPALKAPGPHAHTSL